MITALWVVFALLFLRNVFSYIEESDLDTFITISVLILAYYLNIYLFIVLCIMLIVYIFIELQNE
jgi:hypothetical protein